MPRTLNPFIVNFFKALMKQAGEEIPEDPQARRYEDLYTLFESLLGKNVLAAVPEDKQSAYMEEFERVRDVELDKVAELLEGCVQSPEDMLKKTMEDFSRLYFKNREKPDGA